MRKDFKKGFLLLLTSTVFSSSLFGACTQNTIDVLDTSKTNIEVNEHQSNQLMLGQIALLDGHDISDYKWSGAYSADNTRFSVVQDTGEFRTSVKLDYEDPQDANKDGVYELAIDLTSRADSSLCQNLLYRIIVKDQNITELNTTQFNFSKYDSTSMQYLGYTDFENNSTSDRLYIRYSDSPIPVPVEGDSGNSNKYSSLDLSNASAGGTSNVKIYDYKTGIKKKYVMVYKNGNDYSSLKDKIAAYKIIELRDDQIQLPAPELTGVTVKDAPLIGYSVIFDYTPAEGNKLIIQNSASEGTNPAPGATISNSDGYYTPGKIYILPSNDASYSRFYVRLSEVDGDNKLIKGSSFNIEKYKTERAGSISSFSQVLGSTIGTTKYNMSKADPSHKFKYKLLSINEDAYTAANYPTSGGGTNDLGQSIIPDNDGWIDYNSGDVIDINVTTHKYIYALELNSTNHLVNKRFYSFDYDKVGRAAAVKSGISLEPGDVVGTTTVTYASYDYFKVLDENISSAPVYEASLSDYNMTIESNSDIPVKAGQYIFAIYAKGSYPYKVDEYATFLVTEDMIAQGAKELNASNFTFTGTDTPGLIDVNVTGYTPAVGNELRIMMQNSNLWKDDVPLNTQDISTYFTINSSDGYPKELNASTGLAYQTTYKTSAPNSTSVILIAEGNKSTGKIVKYLRIPLDPSYVNTRTERLNIGIEKSITEGNATKVTALPANGHTLKYAIKDSYKDYNHVAQNSTPVADAVAFTSGDNIGGLVVDKYIWLYEVNATNKVKKFYSIKLTTDYVSEAARHMSDAVALQGDSDLTTYVKNISLASGQGLGYKFFATKPTTVPAFLGVIDGIETFPSAPRSKTITGDIEVDITKHNTLGVFIGNSDGKIIKYAYVDINSSNVKPLSGPSEHTLSATNIAENSTNLVVGTLSATPISGSTIVSWGLEDGYGDNSYFEVDGTDLKFKTSPNYEDKSSYDIKVSVTDSEGRTSYKVFTIEVTNVKEKGVDSDGDGIKDELEDGNNWDDIDSDSDNDGIKDMDEYQNGLDTDNDGIPNWKDTDSDGDGILDSKESKTEDNDGDGIKDYLDGTNNNKESVFNAINKLKIDLGTNKSLYSVVSDLTFPTTLDGVSITWSSSDTIALANDGTVSRQGTDKKVIVTATITKGSGAFASRFEKKFIVVVLATKTDAQIVAKVKELLTFDFIKEDNESPIDIRSILNLPTSSLDGTTLTWKSSDKYVICDISDCIGHVERPSEDTLIKLTATISKGDENATKDFSVLVKGTMTSKDKLENAKEQVTTKTILGTNRGDESIISNLDFNTTKYKFEDGINVAFTSQDTDVVSNSGVVTRGGVDKPVVILATFTHTSNSDIKGYKELKVMVKAASKTVKIATLSDTNSTIVGGKAQFKFTFKEAKDSNLTDTKDIVPTFIAEDENASVEINKDGDQESVMDRSAENNKVKEIKTLIKTNGVIENIIQVRKTANKDETDIKENIVKSEILDANITRDNNGSLIMKVQIDDVNEVETTSDDDGVITQVVKKKTQSDDKNATKIISKLRGSTASVKEDGTVEVISPTLKVDDSGNYDLENGTRDISIKVQSDRNGSIENEYSVQSDTNTTMTRITKINIPSSIKGVTEIKDAPITDINGDEVFMETQSLIVNGRKAIVYTSPSGKTKTKFMNDDGSNEEVTAKALPFAPNDNKNVDISLDSEVVDGEEKLKLVITTPLTDKIEFY
jgi:hypothetical protein